MMFGPLKSSVGVKNQRNTHNPFAIDFNIGTGSQKFNTRNYYSYSKQCTSPYVHVNGAVDQSIDTHMEKRYATTAKIKTNTNNTRTDRGASGRDMETKLTTLLAWVEHLATNYTINSRNSTMNRTHHTAPPRDRETNIIQFFFMVIGRDQRHEQEQFVHHQQGGGYHPIGRIVQNMPVYFGRS